MIVSYLNLMALFFIIGISNFGGGYAMIPLVHRFLVNNWLTQVEFDNLLAISGAMPGAFAINMATYVGFMALPQPILGAIAITVAMALPSIAIPLIAAHFFNQFKTSHFLSLLLKTLRPCLVALLFYTAYKLLMAEFFLIPSASLSVVSQKMGLACLLIAVYATWLKGRPVALIVVGVLLALLIGK